MPFEPRGTGRFIRFVYFDAIPRRLDFVARCPLRMELSLFAPLSTARPCAGGLST